MIDVVSKVPGYMSMRTLGFPRLMPINLTVSVTYDCNSKCTTCNIWRKDKVDELSFSEYEQIFDSIGSTPYWVTVSGGEPFLRDDLVDLVSSMCEKLKPSIVNIPTNGLIADTAERVSMLCKANPRTHFIVNLSIDGIGEKHDKIRGVPKAFEKAMESYDKLSKIIHGNFEVGIHTVVSKQNSSDIKEIYEFVETLKPSSYITEVAEKRVELDTIDSDITPYAAEYAKVAEYLKQKMNEDKGSGIPKLIKVLRSEYYDTAYKTLRDEKQVLPCYAGICSGQITPDGDVWPCCIKAEVLGNLREEEYNFKKIWFSKNADNARKKIKDRSCHCPLANASYTNMLCNPKMLAKVFVKVLT